MRLILLLLLNSLILDCSQVYTLPLKDFLSPHYLSQTLNLTHHLLNLTNPELAKDCWLCLPLSSTSYMAAPTSLHTWSDSSMSFHYKVHGGSPFQLMHLNELYDFQITEMTKKTLTGRAIQLLQTYLNDITPHRSNKVPILGPVTTNTALAFQSPLCIRREHPEGKALGQLDQHLCNFTLNLKPASNWVDYIVTQPARFQNPVRFSAGPTISAAFPTTDTSQFCSGRPRNCSRFHPWQDCTLSRQASCRRLPSYGLTHSKFWVETDRKFIFFENTTSGAIQNNPQGPFQPLTGATLTGTLSAWERENNKLTHLFTIENTFCIETQGTFFLCGTNTYLCLPANWTGTCTLVYLAPKIDIAPNNQSFKVPLTAYARTGRAITFRSLLVGLGIATGLGTGIGGLLTSLSYYQSLSKDLADSLEEIAQSIIAVQDQIDSLAAVTLQNQRGLDLLTAEKGGLCMFLEEDCCFYANQSGIVRDGAQKLADRASKIRKELSESWSSWSNTWRWASWVLPLAGPLLMILLALLFGPCILSMLTQLVTSRLEAFKFQMVPEARTQHYYNPLGEDDEDLAC